MGQLCGSGTSLSMELMHTAGFHELRSSPWAPMAYVMRNQTVTSSDHSTNSAPTTRVWLVSVAVGLVSFLATEFMRYLLVPDIGRRWERLLAEGVSAVVVAALTAKLMHAANQHREAMLLRMQVISEMNHHIRNALAAISLSTDAIQNRQCMRVIADSVNRIEWALREILLRRTPLHEQELNRLRYAQQRSEPAGSAYPGQENANE